MISVLKLITLSNWLHFRVKTFCCNACHNVITALIFGRLLINELYVHVYFTYIYVAMIAHWSQNRWLTNTTEYQVKFNGNIPTCLCVALGTVPYSITNRFPLQYKTMRRFIELPFSVILSLSLFWLSVELNVYFSFCEILNSVQDGRLLRYYSSSMVLCGT